MDCFHQEIKWLNLPYIVKWCKNEVQKWKEFHLIVYKETEMAVFETFFLKNRSEKRVGWYALINYPTNEY